MVNVSKILYVKATRSQFARASSKPPSLNHLIGKPYEQVVKEILEREKHEVYKTYDRYGRLTLVGEAKRKQNLIDRGLSLMTTLSEFFAHEHKRSVDYAVAIARAMARGQKIPAKMKLKVN